MILYTHYIYIYVCIIRMYTYIYICYHMFLIISHRHYIYTLFDDIIMYFCHPINLTYQLSFSCKSSHLLLQVFHHLRGLKKLLWHQENANNPRRIHPHIPSNWNIITILALIFARVPILLSSFINTIPINQLINLVLKPTLNIRVAPLTTHGGCFEYATI